MTTIRRTFRKARSAPRRRTGRLLVAGALAAGGSVVAGSLAVPAGASGSGFAYDWAWTRMLPGAVGESSPTPVDIGGTPAVVFGLLDGQVDALDLQTGATMPGWPADTPDRLPVQSSVSVNGTALYVGVGDASDPSGGYLSLGTNGATRWYTQVSRVPGDNISSGVSSSPAFGSLDGVRAVAAGTLGQAFYALRSLGGAPLPGFPFQSTDTEFATPAIAPLRGGSEDFIVEGATQTGGEAYGQEIPQGGHLWVLPPTGNAGASRPDGGAVCNFEPDEVVDSSPAVGDFLGNRATGIAFGTGTEWAGAADEDKVFAMRPDCSIAWMASLDGGTASSPALVDALGNGYLQVAEATSTGIGSSTAYLLHGNNGRTVWARNLAGGMVGSVTSANLGAGYQDILVPTTEGLYILDGRTGAVVATLALGQLILENSALVTDNANGTIGITIAGQTGSGAGEVRHYVIDHTDGALADEWGSWPEFHHDNHLSGSTLRPVPGT